MAVRIAEMTGDKAVSINRYMKKGEKAVFRSERPLVFVAPVYSWASAKGGGAMDYGE